MMVARRASPVLAMLYMQSTSASDGTYSLTVTFAIGTDPDQAQVLVQNRVAIAMALPFICVVIEFIGCGDFGSYCDDLETAERNRQENA